MTGNQEPVRDYVMKDPDAEVFLNRLYELLTFLFPKYIAEGKNQLVIAIGCTGGRHRSVAIAAALHEHLTAVGINSVNINRDMDK